MTTPTTALSPAEVTLTKIVPLSGALSAAVKHLDPRSQVDETNLPFSQFLKEHGLLMTGGFDLPKLQGLLPDVPRTPAGNAWLAVIEDNITRTEQDGWRGFDEIEFTGPAAALHSALESLADALEGRSALLEDVAWEIRRQVFTDRVELGAVVSARARLNDHGGVALDGTEEPCTKENCCTRGMVTKRAAWDDIELLAPGTRARLTDLITLLDANLPALADNDGGATRLGRS